ncbi:hypothetical protein FG386_001627 [Cryptosporidium ryanae]|uniref:uncharacterized protein n=1 Tax=Cryptosporidium ryanae TaxID=515981 RepID=UPI00351A3770|nr:hypothetical protein FG386_001627 [Cryptosporidium ryanae]
MKLLLFNSLLLLLLIFGVESTNLTCENRLRECEREVKTLLKKNSECSTDLDSLKLEISHLSEIVSQYEKSEKHGASRILITWGKVVEQLKHFTLLFRSLLIVAYSNVPSEVDLKLKQFFLKSRVYADPVMAKYMDFHNKAYESIMKLIAGYSGVIDQYATYIHFYGGIINDRLDKFIAKIESIDQQLVGSIPENLSDRILYIVCVMLVFYAAIDFIRVVLKLMFKCFGMKTCTSNSKKAAKSPSSKSTPGNRRR